MPRYNTSSPIAQLLFNTSPPDFPFRQGRVFWDAADQTLSIQTAENVADEYVVLQVGQEQHVLIRNDLADDIPNGAVGFASGTVGYRPTVTLAKADNILTCGAQGMATQTIVKNTQGVAATFGLVRGLDTQTPDWNEGDLLYVSEATAGELKNTPPSSGYTVIFGRVLRRHPTDGVVFVFPRRVPAFGDVVNSNHTEFEFDGTMVAKGNATTWRDELGALLAQRLESPGSDIVQNLAEVSLTFKASARYPTDYIAYSLQINHDWLVQSDVEFHIHWWQTGAEAANWLIGYRWQVNGQEKTAGWTLVPLTNLVFEYPGAPFTLNQLSDGAATITPPATAQLSDIFQVHLWRDYTNASGLFSGAETSGLDIEATSADMHRRSDTMGSRQEYSK